VWTWENGREKHLLPRKVGRRDGKAIWKKVPLSKYEMISDMGKHLGKAYSGQIGMGMDVEK